jgi:hypothetical protein
MYLMVVTTVFWDMTLHGLVLVGLGFGGRKFLQNIGKHLPDYTASHLKSLDYLRSSLKYVNKFPQAFFL